MPEAVEEVVEEAVVVPVPEGPEVVVQKKEFSKREFSKKDFGKREFSKDFNVNSWAPRSELGNRVRAGEIKSIDEILDNGIRITEPEIVDLLVPGSETVFLEIGQSKGKFGGGKRKMYRHTQKKVREGSRIKFAFLAVTGNKQGYLGVGYGTSRGSVSAKEIAEKNSKLNLIRIIRGCGSWECGCKGDHSLPYETRGKSGSVKVILKPAPKGTGLVASNEMKKILSIAGIKDVWAETYGETRSRVNLLKAVFYALKNVNMFR